MSMFYGWDNSRSRLRSRAQVIAAVGVLSLLATMVTVAPYAAEAQAAAVGTTASAPENTVDEEGVAGEAATDVVEPAQLVVLDVDDTLGFAATVAQGDEPEQTTTAATPTTSEGSSTGAEASVPALDPSIPAADLSIVLSADNEPLLSESFVTYTVTVTNDGPVEAVNAVVTSELPDYMSFIALSGCFLANSTFPECHLNEIPAGASRTFQLLVLTSPVFSGTQVTKASVTSETVDPDPTNNDAELTSMITSRATWRDISATADLSIAKIDLVDPVPAEGTISYSITISNAGPNAAVDVQVTDSLPAGVTLVSVTGCRKTSGIPVCELGTIPPRQTRSYDVVVSADPGTTGVITNAVSVVSRSFDPDGSNNTATETTTVTSGTIILEKQTNPDGSAQQFTFTGDLAGDIGDGQTLEAVHLLAGTYTTTEVIPAGWGIADITCDDSDSSGDTATGVVTFTVAADETVRCVVTNALLGSVTIVKDTVGIDGGFGFTGDFGTFNLTTAANTASTTLNNVLPGSYSVVEDDPSPAFYLTGLDCTDPDAGSSGDVATRTATIDLDPGEDVTCTFTNSESGSVTITKDTIGADGTFGFSGDLGATSITTAANTGSTTITGIAPGALAVTEDPNPAYELTGMSCIDPDGQSSVDLGTRTATADLDPGENVSCAFTNTELGTIIVEKQTLPDGDPQTFSFAGDAAGSIADGETLVIVGLLPGAYSSTETVPAGWALTDITCDDGASPTPSTGNTGTATATFNVESGETVTCVFTNTKDGVIVVEKQTLPDGDSQTFSFSGDVTGTIGDGATATANVAPGAYTATEALQAGWVLTDLTCDDGASATASTGNTGTRTASFNVEPGETVTCVFTNTKLGTIIVEKQTDPDAVTATYDFTGDVSGTIGNGGQLVVNDLFPGTYTSTEMDPSPAFDLTNIICDDGGSLTASTVDVGARTATFELDPGETVTCVFTNTQRGTIIVEKTTDPAGAPDTFVFTGDVSGNVTHGNQLSTTDLVPGTYTATETDPADFNLTDISCVDDNLTGTASTGDVGTRTATFELDPGETVTCTFTNTHKTGTITVTKALVPAADPGEFDLLVDSNTEATDQGNGGTTGAVTVETGNRTAGEVAGTATALADYNTAYSCVESAAAGINAASPITGITATTSNIPVAEGDAWTCTFTNTRKTGTIDVVKAFVGTAGLVDLLVDGNTEATDQGDTGSTGTVTVPTGNRTAGEAAGTSTSLSDYNTAYSCVESAAAGINAASPITGLTATTSNIPVAEGDAWTCTFTNTRQTGTIDVVKAFVGTAGLVDLLVDGNTEATDQGDAGSTGAVTVDSGNRTAGEVAGTATDLADYNTAYSCTEDTNTASPITGLTTTTSNIPVEDGDTWTCTFTNTRQTGTITVTKALVPATDPGQFDLLVDGNTEASDAGHGGTTGAVAVETGSYTAGEAAGTSTSLSDYNSAYSCVESAAGGINAASPITGTTATTASIPVEDGDVWTCTFTNTRKTGTIDVVKDFVGTAGLVDLLVDGNTEATDQGDGDSTGAVAVPTGNRTAGEAAGTLTDLADYNTAYSCVESAAGGTNAASPITGTTATTASIPVAEGDAWTCTFTNTRKTGTITVTKDLMPVSDPGVFDLLVDGGTEATDAGHGGTTGAVTVDTGNRTAGEAAGTATILGDYTAMYSCVESPTGGANAASPITGTATTTSNIPVAEGDVWTCTFTNSADDAPTVASITPADTATAVAPNANVVVTFSEAVGITGDWVTIVCGATTYNPTGSSGATVLAVTDTDPTFTLDPAADLPGGANCAVTVVASQVTDDDAIDPPDNMVANFTSSFTVAPVANNDSYNSIGNVGLDVAAGGVLTNDSGTTVVTKVQGVGTNVGAATVTTASGSVTLDSDGSFEYTPPAGYTGSDTFTYTASDGTTEANQATVTITVAGMIWFIDTTNATAGSGTLDDPFKALATFDGLNTGGAVPAPQAGQSIFIADGAYTGGVGLLNNQILVGDGATTNLAAITGIGVPTHSKSLPTFSGAAPTITNATGNGIDLAANNTVRGLNIGNTPSGHAIAASLNAGTPTINTVMISGTGGILRVDAGGDLSNVLLGSPVSTSSPGGSGVIDLTNTSGNIAFSAVTINGSGGAGIELNTVSGTFTVNSGSIGAGDDPAASAVDIDGGGGTVTIGATLRKTTAGRIVDVTGRTGGAITFTGTLSATGDVDNGINIASNTGGSTTLSGSSQVVSTGTNTAVNLTSNTGHTVNFIGGGLDIDTTSGRGFNATGGGTVNVTGASNSATSTTGTAVFIQNTTIGASGVTFASVSANGSGGGSTNGIFLENTGTSGGGFTVNGGTIQNAEGADLAAEAVSPGGDGIGIHLENVQNVTLSGVTVTNSDNFGIRGHGLTGTATFTNLTVGGTHGTTATSDESAVSIDGITGTLNVTGGAYGGGHEDVFDITTTTGSLTANFSGGFTINASQAASGDNGLQVRSTGSATLNVNVNGSSFNAARSVMLFVDVAGTGGGNVNIGNTAANTFTQNQSTLPGGGAIEVLASGDGNTATVTTRVANNTILAGSQTFEGDTIVLGTGFGFDGTFNVRATGNTIGTSGVNGSAVNPLVGQGDSALLLSSNGGGTVNAFIDSNNIFDWNATGIDIGFDAEGPSDPVGGSVNHTVTNNTVTDVVGVAGLANAGIFFFGGDEVNVCLDVRSNTVNNPDAGGFDIAVDIFPDAPQTFVAPGITGAGGDAELDLLLRTNNGLAVGDVDVFVGATWASAPSTCVLPPP